MKAPINTISRRARNLALALLAASMCSAIGEPFLRVEFVSDLKSPVEMQPEFDQMPIPIEMESVGAPPLVQTFDQVTVTLSPNPPTPEGALSPKPGQFITRFRSIPDEANGYPYSQLLRSWVGSNKGFGIEIKGLKPGTKYRITFYAFDYADPGTRRMGQDLIQDVVDPARPSISVNWEADAEAHVNTPPSGSPGVAIESTSSKNGLLLYSVTPGIPGGTVLLNGLEVEEVK